MSLFKKLFKSSSSQVLAGNYKTIIQKINDLEPEIKKISDQDIKDKTKNLKDQLSSGAKTINDILPEAFALAREASIRTLNQRHFDVQLLGGLVLSQNKIAEMKTGEGKTLTAVLVNYLNALRSEGVHVVTVNDYLAKRDTV